MVISEEKNERTCVVVFAVLRTFGNPRSFVSTFEVQIAGAWGSFLTVKDIDPASIHDMSPFIPRKQHFCSTGSIFEASKAGIVSFLSNLLGLPFDLIKMGISWVIGKVGDIFGIESFKFPF